MGSGIEALNNQVTRERTRAILNEWRNPAKYEHVPKPLQATYITKHMLKDLKLTLDEVRSDVRTTDIHDARRAIIIILSKIGTPTLSICRQMNREWLSVNEIIKQERGK
jgi:hypothetical protein